MASALAHSQQTISVEEYLEGEKFSKIKHEYVGGYVYAMAGASEDHNRIAINILGELRERLRGKRCEPFGSDMKLKLAKGQVFYYPDAIVTCDPSDDAEYVRERPTVVFEILSPGTESADHREKVFAYAQIETLKVYVILSQDKQELTVLRRGKPGPWISEVISGRDAVLKLPEIKVEIPFARIYERTRAARLKS